MKIAYISTPFYADVDFSFIQKMNGKEEIYYFITISPYSLNTTSINILSQHKKSGIFNASIYKELEQYKNIINLDRTFVINRISQKGYALSNIILNIQLFVRLLKIKPDIIHYTSFFQYLDFIFYYFRKKIVLTVHDPFPHSGESTLRNNFNRKLAYRLLNNFVLLNKTQKEEFVTKNRLRNKNIFISRLGVYSHLQSYTKQQISREKYILFFGRISPYKGLEFLLPAMKNVHEKYPDIKLIVAGCGSYYFDIDAYLRLDFIEIYNRHIPEFELAELIQNSLFIVCPYTDATQSGVIMSAFAFCKPVVATNVGGLSEYVENDITGLLVEPKSVDSLAKAMEYLLQSPDSLKKQSESIKKIYFSGIKSWVSIVNDMIGFYRKII